MKSLIVLLACAALTGCATKPTVIVDGVKPKMPADIRQPCDPVPAAPPRGSNMGNLYEWSDAMVDLYAECALRDAKKRAWADQQGL